MASWTLEGAAVLGVEAVVGWAWRGLRAPMGCVLSLEREVAVGFDKASLTSWLLKDQEGTASIVAEATHDLGFPDTRNRHTTTDDRPVEI